MEKRIELSQKLAQIFRRSRYEAGKSQEFMAMGIGVSRKTIQNWEAGTSFPNILQVEEWFRLLNESPIRFYFECMLPSEATQNSCKSADEELDKELFRLIAKKTTPAKRILLFLLNGKHGGSPYAVLQMLAAHLQVPMKDRVLNASVILQNYEMEAELGRLLCPDDVQPDVKFLAAAVDAGKCSAHQRENGYYLDASMENIEDAL